MKIVDGKAVYESAEEETAFRTLMDAETQGLKAKRDELLGKLKSFEPLKDIDPDEYKRLKAEAEKGEHDKLFKAGEFENLKKQLVDSHSKAVQVYEERLQRMQKSLEENVLIATATQAIAQEKGVPILLMPHVRSRTKLDDNGRPVVIDEAGTIRINAKGDPLTISELIIEMKADVNTFGRAFEGNGHSGSGANNSGQNTNTGNDLLKLNPVARLTAARAAGHKT